MAVAERLLNLQPLADTRPDRALVFEAQRGDPDAAQILVQRYYPRIRSFVAHLTYGRGNVEDLTQEVFARALKALGRFNGEYQFEHWILRIAKNLCIDEARRSLHTAELTDPGDLPELEGLAAPDYVWESVSRDLVATVVNKALAALPARQRAILVMREMEGMSYADIAQVVGTNPRGVEATLRRARVRFRGEIARAESAEEADAACRRARHLLSEDPHAARSPEAAQHLAACAGCRRQTRTLTSVGGTRSRAFGFLPAFLGLGGLARRPAHVSAFQRVTGRIRDWVALAALGSGVAAAVPLSRAAEVAGGILVATAVTMAPAIPAITTAAPTVATAAPVPVQVASVSSESVLFHPSTVAPVTFSPGAPIVAQPSSTPGAPSLVAPTDASATSGILDGLGLGTAGQNLVTPLLTNVGSVGDMLSHQLQQVSQLATSTGGPTGGLGTSGLTPAAGGAQPLAGPLGGAVTGTLGAVKALTDGLKTNLKLPVGGPAGP